MFTHDVLSRHITLFKLFQFTFSHCRKFEVKVSESYEVFGYIVYNCHNHEYYEWVFIGFNILITNYQ